MLFTVDVKEQERNGKVNRKQFLELEIWFILILRLYGGDHHHHSWLCDFGPTLAIKPPSRLNANLPGTKLSLVFTAVGNISDTCADKILMVRPRAVSPSFGKQVDNSQRKGGDWVQPTISFPWKLKKQNNKTENPIIAQYSWQLIFTLPLVLGLLNWQADHCEAIPFCVCLRQAHLSRVFVILQSEAAGGRWQGKQVQIVKWAKHFFVLCLRACLLLLLLGWCLHKLAAIHSAFQRYDPPCPLAPSTHTVTFTQCTHLDLNIT